MQQKTEEALKRKVSCDENSLFFQSENPKKTANSQIKKTLKSTVETKASYRMLSPISKRQTKNKKTIRSFYRKGSLLKDKDVKISAKDFVDISAPASD